MKQKTKWITPSEYAETHFTRNGNNHTLQNVTKKLRNNRNLEGVLAVKKYSRFYLLKVPI